MFFRRFVLNQHFCFHFAMPRALTRSVYQRSTRDRRLSLSFFFFSVSPLFVLVVEGRADIGADRDKACNMNLYVLYRN